MTKRRTLPNPAEVVREVLAESRQRGDDFDRAWDRAWKALVTRTGTVRPEPRAEWRAAIRDTRGEWRAAYERVDTHFSLAVSGREDFATGIADYLTDPWAVLTI